MVVRIALYAAFTEVCVISADRWRRRLSFLVQHSDVKEHFVSDSRLKNAACYQACASSRESFGGAEGSRTPDPRLAKATLSH